MGGTIQRMTSALLAKQEMKIIMVGLDAAGKTTILYKLKLGEIVTTIPTIGMNVETVAYKNVTFTVWDVGGRTKIRALWRHYYQNTRVLIFVVDSNDRERLAEAKEEVLDMLREDLLKDCILLVLCNKQDLPNAMSREEIIDKMGLCQLKERTWAAFDTCATTGDGLYEALDWVSHTASGKMVNEMGDQEEEGEWKPDFKKEQETLTNVPGDDHVTQLQKNYSKDLELYEYPLEKIGDSELMELCLNGDVGSSELLTKKTFNHAAMLRLIHVFLSQVTDRSEGRQKAVDKIFESMEKVNNALDRIHHVTLIYFWIQLIDLCLHFKSPASSPALPSFSSLISAYPFLLADDLTSQYYSLKEMFENPESVSGFVTPDKKPLPSVLNFNVRERDLSSPPSA